MNGTMVKSYKGADVARWIQMGAYLLVFTGALALALTGKLVASPVILILAMIGAWLAPPGNTRSGWWEAASFLYLLFFFVDLFRISGALAPALVHLFTFILVNKIFNLQTPRDYYQLYLLTFLTVLAAASLSVEIEMFYMIGLYLVALIWNVISLTLFQEWKKEGSDAFPISLFSPGYFLLAFGSAGFAFLIALGIFFLLPRMQLGFFGNIKQAKTQYVSGFSQKVNLGDISSVQNDPSLAMRVKVTPHLSIHHYWRGIAFDHYDGKAWSAVIPGNRFLFEDSSSNYRVGRYTGEPEKLVRQEFYMAPIDTRVIFGLDRIVSIKGNFGDVVRDANGTLTGMSRATFYEVQSRLPTVDLEQLKKSGDEIPEQIAKYYLQLPFHSDRIEKLGRDITIKANSDVERSIAVRNYLQTNYQYTVSGLPLDSEDPVSQFLFEKKAGHCEYFATGMALILRHIGIPARVVNGFREGDYNELGGFFVVRNSDAHSWVEVYVGGQWLSFDPSPFETAGSGSSFLSLSKLFESVSFFWDRYILIFSAQDQIDVLLSVRDQYREVSERFRHGYETVPESLLGRLTLLWTRYRLTMIALLAGLALMAIAVRILQRHRRKARISASPILFYQEMLSILERKGFSRRPQFTPSEFVESIQESVSDSHRRDLERLTRLFYRSRFGNYSLSPSDQSLIRSALDRLQQMQGYVRPSSLW